MAMDGHSPIGDIIMSRTSVDRACCPKKTVLSVHPTKRGRQTFNVGDFVLGPNVAPLPNYFDATSKLIDTHSQYVNGKIISAKDQYVHIDITVFAYNVVGDVRIAFYVDGVNEQQELVADHGWNNSFITYLEKDQELTVKVVGTAGGTFQTYVAKDHIYFDMHEIG